jgi:uncharacterized RDD family membrane protein YckC
MLKVFSAQFALGAILQLALFLLYMPALWASSMQATAGQRICALRVINAIDGGRVSFMRGLLRVFGMMLSGLIWGLAFSWSHSRNANEVCTI